MTIPLQWLLTGQSGRYAGWVAVFLAGVLLCGALSNSWVTWCTVHRTMEAEVSGHPLDTAPVLPQKQLAEWHLFGAHAAQNTAALPETHLQLELTGVMGASPDAPSMAIIAIAPGDPGQVYRVGDTLPASGVRVHAITQEGVVLENGGHFERLDLQRSPLQFKSLPTQLEWGG